MYTLKQIRASRIAKVKVMTRDAMEQTTPTATILVEKTIDNFIKSVRIWLFNFLNTFINDYMHGNYFC